MLQEIHSPASLGLALTAALLLMTWRAFFTRVSSVPGPLAARFSDLWYAHRVFRGEFEKDNIELHRKYGPVVRYGPKRFSIDEPKAANLIYGLGSRLTKSSWYQTWTSPSPQAWNLFGDQDAKRHSSNRRQYQNTYSMSSLVHYEPYADECADLLCQRLSEMGARDSLAWSQPVNMGHWLQCYAFDVIGLITYSKRIGFLDHGEDVGDVMRNLGDHLAYASIVGVYPWLHPILFRLRNWLAGSRGTGRQYIINFTQERMATHQAEPKAKPVSEQADTRAGVAQQQKPETMDFLSRFLQKHSENPSTFTPYHVLMGCVSNMVAGSDTTSISLSAILYHVLRNLNALNRLRDEIDQNCPQNKKASPHISFAQSQAMPYLQAVIKEALRAHPATGLPLERVVPEGGLTIAEVLFPQGSIVGINSWVAHSNRTIFGDDADIFNPDRWLCGDTERLSTMNRHWMPFGLGSRNCIGRHISMLEMCKLVPRLIRDFEFQPCDEREWQTRNHWFVKPGNLRMLVRPRVVQS